MNLQNYYYYFESALTPRTCDDIINYGLQHKPEMALTGGIERDDGKSRRKDGKLKKNVVKQLHVKRKSDIVWMNDKWIYKEIHPYIHEANAKAGWNFDWDFSESCQFTKYGVGQYYGWHCDSWDKPYNKPDSSNEHGKIRKLSVTVSLSDPSEYEGGEFQIMHMGDNKMTTMKPPMGTAIIFSSTTRHRVRPIKSGKRISLVGWYGGPNFR